MKVIFFAIATVISFNAHANSYDSEQIKRIKQSMIQNSINNYSGSCPCPYNFTRNGRICGGNSAYSRPGGASPLCYPDDISNDEVIRVIKMK